MEFGVADGTAAGTYDLKLCFDDSKLSYNPADNAAKCTPMFQVSFYRTDLSDDGRLFTDMYGIPVLEASGSFDFNFFKQDKLDGSDDGMFKQITVNTEFDSGVDESIVRLVTEFSITPTDTEFQVIEEATETKIRFDDTAWVNGSTVSQTWDFVYLVKVVKYASDESYIEERAIKITANDCGVNQSLPAVILT